MAESNEPKPTTQLPDLYNPFKDRLQMPDGVEQSFESKTYDPEIKAAQIQASFKQLDHALSQDAADKALVRRQTLIDTIWAKGREVIFFAMLGFSIFQCWNIAATSSSVDAQKAAIATGASLISGTVAYFLGKQASSKS